MTNLVAKAKGAASSTLGPALQRNGTLFTVFLVALILVAGTSLVSGNSSWWLSALAISFVFLVIFIFLNARVMIKAVVATIVTLMISNSVLQLGVVLSPYSAIGLIWMGSTLFLYCGLLALSYSTVGYRSRWTGILIAVLVQTIVAITLLTTLPALVAIGLSVILATLSFLFYYKILGKILAHTSAMPKSFYSEEVEGFLLKAADEEGWNIRKMERRAKRKKEKVVDYLAWNSDHAFVLHPVKLNSKFAISPTRKSVRLTHDGYSINSWLLALVNKQLPIWRSRNAGMMLVLLDLDSMNGTKAETIGVAVPDSSKRIPVGIFPTKRALNSGPTKSKLFSSIDNEYGKFTEQLTEKQRKAMSEIGIADESAYL